MNAYKVETLYAIHSSDIKGNERTCELLIKGGNPKKFLFTLDELFEVNAKIPEDTSLRLFN